MADMIVIRLHPDKPIGGADFTNYLNGLTLTAYDLSTGDPKVGASIGTATYLPPPNPATPWIPDPATRIVQHFRLNPSPPPSFCPKRRRRR
ncbi:MAG TPA: hypothetical protein VFB38_21335 [Chthonomonadaceae bacterium]|nr:hypothetical protein [Chthonomonadaceae bacterium]HZT40954.1 hypothetical protein [Chthonomonadaceae bacterium]